MSTRSVPMAAVTRQSLATFSRRLLPLAGLTLVVYAPLAFGSRYLASAEVLTADSAAIASAAIGFFLLPILRAAVLRLCLADAESQPLSAFGALRQGLRYWFQLLFGYFAVSIVFVAWLGIGIAPGAALMHFTGYNNPWVLIPFTLPALYVLARYGFMEPFIVVDGQLAYDARQNSVRLASSSRAQHLRVLVAGLLLIAPATALETFADQIAPYLTPTAAGIAAWPVAATIDVLSGFFELAYLVFFFHWHRELTRP